MRAIVCPRLGGPDVLEIRELPEPEPGPGEIQVRLAAWGVNHVDVLMAAGLYQHKPALPFVPGLEAAGTVSAVGPGVEGFERGDRVMTSHRPGAFAEVVTLPAAKAFRIPAAMGFASAAAFRSAYQTAYHALADRARLEPGETVLVHGSTGGVGLAAVHVAKLMGASVIATSGSAAKLAAVKAEGADHVIETAGGFRDRVKALTQGRGVDVVYDPVGGDLLDESMRCLAWGARLLVIGFTSGRRAEVRTNHLLIKGASVLGVRAGEIGRQVPGTTERNLATLLDWVEAGRLRPHISHVFPFERAADALRAVAAREVIGKAVLTADGRR